MTIDQLTQFFGICTLINASILIIATVWLILFREFTSIIHSSLFGVEKAKICESYYQYLANYKIAIMIFNIGPYVALKLMS